MRLSLTLLLACAGTLITRADSDVPVQFTPIPVQSFMLGAAPRTIDLSTQFTLPGVDAAQIRQITTSQGNIFVELLPAAAPLTVANFLSYVNDGSYTESLVHRTEPGFVIQGGGFKVDSNLSPITAKPAVVNEYNLPNARGTMAMAKIGPLLGEDPTDETINSATNQWFINLEDNSEVLDENNNGGFTVFARVLGKGMAVADAIAALPRYNLDYINPAFGTLPLADTVPGQPELYVANLVAVRSITAAPPLCPANGAASILSFRVISTNPAVVTATVQNSLVTLTPGKVAGSAQVIIRDLNGNADDAALTVTVSAPAKTTPVSQTVQTGQAATFNITAAPSGSTYLWQRKPAGAVTWVTLAEAAPFSGVSTPTLVVDPTTLAMNGDLFQCLVTTGGVTAIRTGAKLAVVPALPALQAPIKTFVAAPVAIDLSGGSPTGLTFYATGLPAGLTLNAATGQITGSITAKPGTYVVTYWSQNGALKSAAQTVTFTVNPFLGYMVRSYETMLVDDFGLPAGKIELNVTATGAFTGRLTCADVKPYALRGQLTLTSDLSYSFITIPIARSVQPGSPFSLILNVFNDSTIAARLDLDVTSPVVVGTTPYTSATIVPAKASGAPWIGTYTLALGNPQNLDDSPLDAAITPAGIGYATVKIATSGLMSLKGKTADGTPFTAALASSFGAPNQAETGFTVSYRAYIKPYKLAGAYLAGWMQLEPRGDSTKTNFIHHVAPSINSDFYWAKPANAADKAYPQGFGPVGLNVSVEPWRPAVSLAGTFPLTVSEAGISNDGANSDHLPVGLTLAANYTYTLASPSDSTNPSRWAVKINPATGSFTGSFTLLRTVNGTATTLKVPVEGVLQQLAAPVSSGTPIAQGFFLLPPNSTSGPGARSGRVELSKP